MELTVENMCGLLIRSKLLTSEGVRAMYQRWQFESKGATNDAGQFGKWLVGAGYVTAYQSALLARGHADYFFIQEYKILDRLGQGRMAGVYKAIHTCGQVVAIKVLPPTKAKDAQMFARFQREARLALCLKHPNVVRTFEVGATSTLHFIVMEYLDGETLDDVLARRSKLPVAEAVRVAHQALQGLQHIHQQSLIHRDLKPANLMLVPASPKGGPNDHTLRATLKILDIGLGRALFDENDSSVDEDMQLTGEGVLLGTPDYLAPEQARDAHGSDIRADIYSLGCVLYHLLCGQPPFPDTNIISQMVRHATEPPKPLRELNPAIPEALQQTIISGMMAKHPAARFATPEKAAQALQGFLPPNAEAAQNLDADPRMQAYLKWLDNRPPAPRPVPAAAPAPARPAAPAVPGGSGQAARPALPVGRTVKDAEKALKKKRAKKRRRLRAELPVARPAASAKEGGVGVELIPVAATSRREARRFLGLTLRDWLFLTLGAGSVLIAVALGLWLARPPAE